MRLEGDGESESARPDHAPDDHPFHSNPIPITCARRRSTVDAYLVDLVMAVGERGKKGADRLRWCGDEGVSFQGTEQVLSNPWSAPSEHARGPHPRLNHLASRVRCRYVVPQASSLPGDEGCARGPWGLKKMVGILDISVARSARGFFKFLAEEAAGRSEGGASVRRDIATIACRARVRPGNRVCMMCGSSREVMGRWFRLGTGMNS